MAAGGFATLPTPAPTRTGYTLAGWFAPGATTAFAFVTTPITANITLTAQWTAQAVQTGQWIAIMAGDEGSTFPGSIHITSVAHGSGRWVAVGGGRIAHSTDGISWTAVPVGDDDSPSIGSMRDVAYGSGRWVAVGNNGRMAYMDH